MNCSLFNLRMRIMQKVRWGVNDFHADNTM